MCLCDLIDLPIERVPPAIAATWRNVYSLAPVEAIPCAEAGVGGTHEKEDAA